MELTFKTAIELFAAGLAVLFSVYLLTSSKDKSRSNSFMSVFLVLLGFNLGQYYIEQLLDPISPNLSIFIGLTFFMLPASLYLYTKSSLIPLSKLNWKHTLHLLPIIVLNIFIIPSIYIENLNENPVETSFHKQINIAFYFIFYLLLFAYQIASFYILRKNKRLYYENYSNNSIQRFEYLRKLNVLFTIIFLLSAIKNILVFNFQGSEIQIAISLVRLSLLFFFCWIILKRLDAPELFQERNHETKPVKELMKNKVLSAVKNEPDTIIDEHTKRRIAGLTAFMKDEEPYLDASLSIKKLSKMTNTPSKELSILINHTLNKHFFDFVNEYRIQKAMELLHSAKNNKMTILEILYEVGFNSKSSFNTAFKKHTGLTPTEYKKKAGLLAA